MLVESCMPIIPSTDLEKSLRFWVEGLGMTMERPMHQDGRLVGCMLQNGRLWFWLNQAAPSSSSRSEAPEGIRLYWAPVDLPAMRERLLQLGFEPSEIVNRDYGQTEFFVTDHDGHSHCFGIPTAK